MVKSLSVITDSRRRLESLVESRGDADHFGGFISDHIHAFPLPTRENASFNDGH
jgi:hypothetical protein